jgi:hypothetical protein
MNWKKSLCVAILTGAALAAMAGCGQVETTIPATVQTTSVTQQSTAVAVQTQSATKQGTAPTGQMPPSGVSINGTMPAAPTMDLAAAAAKLGITQVQLSAALGNTQSGFPDLASAATKLGITEDALRQALGFSNNGTMPGGTQQGGPPPSGTPPTGTLPAS